MSYTNNVMNGSLYRDQNDLYLQQMSAFGIADQPTPLLPSIAAIGRVPQLDLNLADDVTANALAKSCRPCELLSFKGLVYVTILGIGISAGCKLFKKMM